MSVLFNLLKCKHWNYHGKYFTHFIDKFYVQIAKTKHCPYVVTRE